MDSATTPFADKAKQATEYSEPQRMDSASPSPSVARSEMSQKENENTVTAASYSHSSSPSPSRVDFNFDLTCALCETAYSSFYIFSSYGTVLEKLPFTCPELSGFDSLEHFVRDLESQPGCFCVCRSCYDYEMKHKDSPLPSSPPSSRSPVRECADCLCGATNGTGKVLCSCCGCLPARDSLSLDCHRLSSVSSSIGSDLPSSSDSHVASRFSSLARSPSNSDSSPVSAEASSSNDSSTKASSPELYESQQETESESLENVRYFTRVSPPSRFAARDVKTSNIMNASPTALASLINNNNSNDSTEKEEDFNNFTLLVPLCRSAVQDPQLVAHNVHSASSINNITNNKNKKKPFNNNKKKIRIDKERSQKKKGKKN